MKKDAYYFPHFSNARNDRKIRRMVKLQGLESYAVYFMILEVLREQDGFRYPMEDVDLLADEFKTSEDRVKSIVDSFDLFTIEDDYFYSPRLNEYMTPYLEKKERARNASLKRWNKDGNANGMQMHTKSNADQNPSKVKKSKVKKSKVNMYKPTVTMVEEHFFLSNKVKHEEVKDLSKKFMRYYDKTDWKDEKGEDLKNWKRLANGWINNQFDKTTTFTGDPF